MSFQLEHVLCETGQPHMEKALKELPANPHDAYQQVMTRIRATGSHTSVTAIRTLTWIFYAARPLLMDELRDALSVEAGATNIDGDRKLVTADIIEMCQSLVIHEESSGIIRFIHPTVQEFLKSIELLPVMTLAKTCLNFLENPIFDNICSDLESMELRVQTYRFCLYASKFWAFHTRGDAEVYSCIRQAVFRLFELENKRNSILQMEEYEEEAFVDDRLKLFFIKGQTILHIIAKNGLPTICRHFLDAIPKDSLYIF